VTLNSEHIILGAIYDACLVLPCIKQDTKFEVPSFVNSISKDVIVGAKLKKTGHVTLITPIRGSPSSKG